MKQNKIHFMGIGGAGLSAVANLAKNAGFEVSGCDLDEGSPFLKNIFNKKIPFFPKHEESHLDNIDYLVISPAVETLDPKNPELNKGKEKNIPIYIGEEFLAKYLLPGKKVIAVSGTHGKSTTTAMIGKILEEAGLDPSVMVGAIVNDWGVNYRVGKGEYFVLEADEYKEKFLLYRPYISVVSAIEMDHPEYFINIDNLKKAFRKFIDQTIPEGKIILGKNLGFKINNKSVHVLAKDFQINNFDLKLIGDFNQENAALAFETAKLIGIDKTKAKKTLEKFSGIARRFEFKGEEKGVKVFEDYGHHPSAIKATILAAKKKFSNKRIWLVFQPHMFSRTKYLFADFVEIFKNLPIEEIILVDIYAAREENKENISSKSVVEAVNSRKVKYIGNFEQSAFYLVKKLAVNDIVIVMGAGDIYKLSTLILKKLSNKK